MTALGKIRSKGILLIIIIGLGLFAFIAEEAFRSCNGIKGQNSQQIGEVLGEKIYVQDFQKLLEEYQDAMKLTMRTDNLSEDQLNQLKDQVWQQLVSERDKGKAVLLVSLELDEVMSLSDRILVMYEGKIVGEFDPKKITVQELGLYMAGAKRAEKEGEAI